MAGDWIKMRVGLDRDPRVIRMADYLATQREFMDWLTDPVRRTCDKSAYEHVTRNVTVALCVTGLLVTWGAAREQGDRDDDDLVINHCDLETLSAISGVPCFGDALTFVGWAIETVFGSVVLPKFFKDNESPDDKHKRQAAERQARFRAKQAAESNATSNVTDNVTVTHREEKRREEKREKEQKRASRLTADWKPTDEQIDWATKERPDLNVKLEADSFRDYWIAKPGKDGRKEDWEATWRNWIRRANARPQAASKQESSPAASRRLA